MVKRCLMALLGSCILAFGLCHIHALSGVTEGGQLGLTLLLHHWLGITPALSALVIAVVTFVICLGGIYIGRKAGTRLAGKAGILGGAILIFIGLEIFITGVFF